MLVNLSKQKKVQIARQVTFPSAVLCAKESLLRVRWTRF